VAPLVSVVDIVPVCSAPEPGSELNPVAAVAVSEDSPLKTDVAETDDATCVEGDAVDPTSHLRQVNLTCTDVANKCPIAIWIVRVCDGMGLEVSSDAEHSLSIVCVGGT
jgi:hypothetical protein